MSDFITTGLMWSIYSDMEGELMRFLDYVPYAPEHKKVYSYHLLRLMLQVGGYVDTAFKTMALYTKFDGNAKCKEIRDKRVKRETVTINLFREAFEPIYGLSHKSVLLKSPRHFPYPPLAIDRFNPFSEFGKNKSPRWWNAYNGLKHDWLKNLKLATVENTMNALSGAFLLNATHEPSLLQLAKAGIVRTYISGGQEARFSEELLAKKITRKHPLGDTIIIIDSQLFRWRFT